MKNEHLVEVKSVWYAIPSALPSAAAMECIQEWMGMGYKVAVFRDKGTPPLPVDICMEGEYPGYASAVNALVREILEREPETEWIVTGGDDMVPDLDTPPDEIARQCSAHFGGTLGVMQPTGDTFGTDESGLCAAERVTISPWMGREWCQRSYNGNGPLCEEYEHYFVDEDLHDVASGLGLLRHRPDLTHFHRWWRRVGGDEPEHMDRHSYTDGRGIFMRRKKEGFPESGLKTEEREEFGSKR